MSPAQSIKPSRLKAQFAYRFLRALKIINKTKKHTSIIPNKRSADHHNNQIIQRSNHVKIAAYASMASVVGSRRAWSRSILWKIRNRSINRGLVRKDKKRVVQKITHHHAKESVAGRRNPNPNQEEDVVIDPCGYSGLEEKLRKLVPGAETMDACGLLDEAADYIKCLATQVEVMRTLLDLYSTT